MKKRFRKLLSLLMAVAVTCSLLALPSFAAGETRKCYTISSSNTTAYSNTGLSTKLGTIYPTDELTILDVTGSYCRVTYPTSNGSKTGYIPTSSILTGTSSSNKKTATAKITTYRRNSTSNTYGSISKGDVVSILGTKGSYTQVKYPVSGGYKYAFITTSDANKYLGTGSSTTSSSSAWQTPMSNMVVCGNDWGEYYAPKAAAGRPNHCGIDVKSSSGNTAIYAAAAGTVAGVGYNGDNGNYVVIKHTVNGTTVYSFYAHLNSYCVSTNSTVAKGAKIGVMGNTGASSTGGHLHFAIANQYKAGSYYGYIPSFSGNKATYSGVTFYNPHYVISHNALP